MIVGSSRTVLTGAAAFLDQLLTPGNGKDMDMGTTDDAADCVVRTDRGAKTTSAVASTGSS